MTIDHAERVPLGRTSLTVSRLGFGGASIGGLFSAVDDASGRNGPPRLVARAQRIGAACSRHGVPLRAVAMQYAKARPAVTSLMAGVRPVAHLDEYPTLFAHPIPAHLGRELRAEGLIVADASVPQA